MVVSLKANGKYERSGIIWCKRKKGTFVEQLNAKAKKYIRLNSNVKGHPNLTVGSFCQWVNNTLLPNTTLEPGFPRKISQENGCMNWDFIMSDY